MNNFRKAVLKLNAKGVSLTTAIEKSVRKYCRLIRSHLHENLIDIRLYGSVARGTASPDSDIDILIVVKNEDSLTKKTILDIGFDVSLEYDVIISPIIMTIKEYNNPIFQETLFYNAIQKEGVPL